MPAALLGATVAAVLASGFMWWATRRNAFWAMGAAVVFVVMMFALAVLVAWLIANAAYGT